MIAHLNNLGERVKAHRHALIVLHAERAALLKERANLQDRMSTLQEEKKTQEEAREVLNTIAQLRREASTHHIEKVVTSGLQPVFGPKVELSIIEKVTKRAIEYQFAVTGAAGHVAKNIRRQRGGGLENLMSLLLTVTLSLMLRPKGTRFFVFDEKFANLSAGKREDTYRLLADLAQKLDCQFLMVSQVYEFTHGGADAIYEFRQNAQGVTSAKKVQG